MTKFEEIPAESLEALNDEVDPRAPSEDQIISMIDAKRAVERIMGPRSSLNSTEKRFLRIRGGLPIDSSDPKDTYASVPSREQIGEEVGGSSGEPISAQRVRKIEENAIRKALESESRYY